MTEHQIYDVLKQGLWVAVAISTPILSAALITGIIIGLLQALTSIQEMTLTFVPKLLAMMVVFWVSMNFMSGTLITYFENEIVAKIVEN